MDNLFEEMALNSGVREELAAELKKRGHEQVPGKFHVSWNETWLTKLRNLSPEDRVTAIDEAMKELIPIFNGEGEYLSLDVSKLDEDFMTNEEIREAALAISAKHLFEPFPELGVPDTSFDPEFMELLEKGAHLDGSILPI